MEIVSGDDERASTFKLAGLRNASNEHSVSVARVEQHVPEKLEISHGAWLRQPTENRDRRFIFRETTKSLITDIDSFDREFSLRKLQRFPFEAKNKVHDFDLHTISIIASVYLNEGISFGNTTGPLQTYKRTIYEFKPIRFAIEEMEARGLSFHRGFTLNFGIDWKSGTSSCRLIGLIADGRRSITI